MAPEKQGRRSGFIIPALIAAICLLPAIAYFVLQARLPAAGAYILPNSSEAWQPDGVVVGTFRDGRGVQDGDVVVAINGRPLSEWAPLIAFGRSDPRWQMGQNVPFTVRRDGRQLSVDVELAPYPQFAAFSNNWSIGLFSLVTFLVGSFVLWRRPQLEASRTLFQWGCALLGAMTWSFYLDVVQLTTPIVYWLFMYTTCAVYLLFWTSGLHLALTFPTPHPRLRGREHLAWLVHPIAATAGMLIALVPIWRGDPLAWIYTWLRSVGVIALAVGILMIFTFAYGYRRYYNAEDRRRARIFLFTSISTGSVGIVLWLLAPLILGRPPISANLAGLLLLPAPIAMAVSIVRDRLFDIDVIIRRTLIYTLLTAALALIYFTSVVVLQSVLGAFSGGFSNLAIVLSTLAIATLFSPMRRWIQTAIDRRFYRRKYDAAATVAKFASLSRNEVNLDTLSNELVRLIQQTVQPTHVSLWLRGDWRTGD